MRLVTERTGSILMETVLVMPLFLAMVMGALQFAHIYIGKQIVNYAAFSAARSTLSAKAGDEQTKAEEAAKRVLSWLILPIGKLTKNGVIEEPIDGVLMPDYSGSDMKSHLLGVKVETKEKWLKAVEVRFAFPLEFPLAAQIIRWGMNLPGYEFEKKHSVGIDLKLAGVTTPHLVLTERCVLPKPYIIK